MALWELMAIAVGLSMDAFAVAICKGLSMKKRNYTRALITAAFFGGFQAAMPLAGYLLGVQFQQYITAFDHWVAFVLLLLIGAKMLHESREMCHIPDDKFCLKNLSLLAVATSIDALAVGVSFAFLEVEIIPAVTLIGVTTFVLSFLGVGIGNTFGFRFKSRAEAAGGIILIAMGFKILLSHLGIAGF